MLETVQAWVNYALPYVERFWPYISAVLLGYGIAMGVTQTVKYAWRVALTSKDVKAWAANLTDESEKFAIRMIACSTAFAVIFREWPYDGFLWALAFALALPVVYNIGMGWAYSKWPQLEKWVSAKPRVIIKPMEDGGLGIKVDDDKTRPLTKEERAEVEATLGKK